MKPKFKKFFPAITQERPADASGYPGGSVPAGRANLKSSNRKQVNEIKNEDPE